MRRIFGILLALTALGGVALAVENTAGKDPGADKEVLARQAELAERILKAVASASAEELNKCVTPRTLFWKGASPGEGGFGGQKAGKLAPKEWLIAAAALFQKDGLEKFFQETEGGYICEVRWKGKAPDYLITLTITMHDFGTDGWRATALSVWEHGLRKK